ncbi:hypothetical protein V8E55_007873 [Tylopilus felleus]
MRFSISVNKFWVQSRRSMYRETDVHARLMSRHEQVPECHHLQVCLLLIPAGITMIQAIANDWMGLNVIAELIVGYILPGRPITMMFKTWGYITTTQDVATIVAGAVQLGVQAWMFTNIHKWMDSFAPTEVFGTASIIWGVIGPPGMISSGQIYSGLTWWFLIGAICPVIAYMIRLRWPNSFIRYVNFPVQRLGIHCFSEWVELRLVGDRSFIFQYLLWRRWSAI